MEMLQELNVSVPPTPEYEEADSGNEMGVDPNSMQNQMNPATGVTKWERNHDKQIDYLNSLIELNYNTLVKYQKECEGLTDLINNGLHLSN